MGNVESSKSFLQPRIPIPVPIFQNLLVCVGGRSRRRRAPQLCLNIRDDSLLAMATSLVVTRARRNVHSIHILYQPDPGRCMAILVAAGAGTVSDYRG